MGADHLHNLPLTTVVITLFSSNQWTYKGITCYLGRPIIAKSSIDLVKMS